MTAAPKAGIIALGFHQEVQMDGSSGESRPWGGFEVLHDGADHKVKSVFVRPGHRLSLQRHRKRAEHWFVVKGRGIVTLDGAETGVREGSSIDIPAGSWHRIRNTGGSGLVYIEVQTGSYFGEDDIERKEDDYGRT